MLRSLLVLLAIVLLFAGTAFAEQLAITTEAYQSGIVGMNYSAPSYATGGDGAYTWGIASGALPGGTTLNSASGVISGTPSGTGRFSFTVQVTDTSGGSATKAYVIDIYHSYLTYDSGGNDAGTAIATDSSGHIYVAGYSYNGANNDYRTIKYGTDGSTFWVRSHDSGGDDQASGIAVDTGNNVYVVGSRMIIKYDQDGNVLWMKDFGESAKAVTTDTTGNLYVVGATTIVKYDAQGEQVWSRSNSFSITGMTRDEAGNIIVIGFYDTAKYDPSGLLLWTKRVQTGCSYKGSVATDLAGNIYGTMCNLIFKLSPDGTVVWQKSGGGADAIGVKGDDIFTTTSYTNTQQVYYSFVRWKTDGTWVWKDFYRGYFGFSYPAALALNSAGDAFFVTGKSARDWGTTTPTDMRTVAVIFPRIAPVADVSAKPGVPFTVALKSTGGVPPYTYSCSRDLGNGNSYGVNVDQATGVLTDTIYGAGSYVINCSVRDATHLVIDTITDPKDNKAIKITVFGITTSSLPFATVGSSYSASISLAGGVAPYQWSITAGSLPPELSFDNASGIIGGTPTSVGTWNFTVQALDAEGSSSTASLSIPVYQPLAITTTSLAIGNYGSPYNLTIAASGGKPSYTWSVVSGNLPPGFTLSSSTGAISGTYNNTGIFTFIVQVRDANGSSATQSYTLYITLPLNIATESLPSGAMAWPYSNGLYGGNGVPPYTWQITGGLPLGFDFTSTVTPSSPFSANGQIAGTPLAPGTYTFTVKLTDAIGTAITRQFSINIQPMACSTQPVGLSKNGTTNYWEQYAQLQSAYDAAGDYDTILPQAVELTGHLVMNKDINVVMRGGGSCSYQKYQSYTVLHGDLTVSAGSVVIEDFIIM